jgi:hypothetical protein
MAVVYIQSSEFSVVGAKYLILPAARAGEIYECYRRDFKEKNPEGSDLGEMEPVPIRGVLTSLIGSLRHQMTRSRGTEPSEALKEFSAAILEEHWKYDSLSAGISQSIVIEVTGTIAVVVGGTSFHICDDKKVVLEGYTGPKGWMPGGFGVFLLSEGDMKLNSSEKATVSVFKCRNPIAERPVHISMGDSFGLNSSMADSFGLNLSIEFEEETHTLSRTWQGKFEGKKVLEMSRILSVPSTIRRKEFKAEIVHGIAKSSPLVFLDPTLEIPDVGRLLLEPRPVRKLADESVAHLERCVSPKENELENLQD